MVPVGHPYPAYMMGEGGNPAHHVPRGPTYPTAVHTPPYTGQAVYAAVPVEYPPGQPQERINQNPSPQKNVGEGEVLTLMKEIKEQLSKSPQQATQKKPTGASRLSLKTQLAQQLLGVLENEDVYNPNKE